MQTVISNPMDDSAIGNSNLIFKIQSLLASVCQQNKTYYKIIEVLRPTTYIHLAAIIELKNLLVITYKNYYLHNAKK